MPVRFFYVDESHDKHKFCLSALGIRHSVWKECFEKVRSHRERLKVDYGIYLRKEIHAYNFLAGRGKISDRTVTKWQRCRIFDDILRLVASLPEVMLFNICLDKSAHRDPQMVAWDRLLNRVERTLKEMEQRELPKRRKLASEMQRYCPPDIAQNIDHRLQKYRSRAVIFSDEGREFEIERALRKMHVFNPIPSRYGHWGNGKTTKNITADRIIEDPVFKKSSRSYLVQLADCIAYALLKRETIPVPRIKKYGIDKMFEKHLAGICFKHAAPNDPLGVVRK